MVLLCLVCLFSQFNGIAYGEQIKAISGDEGQAPFSVITLKGLEEGYNKDEAWIDRQIDSGYSLYQIYQALNAEQNGVTSAETWLSKEQVKKQVINNSGVDLKVNEAADPIHGQKDKLTSIYPTTDPLVDDTAWKRLNLQDTSSMYMITYGSDGISLASGDLQVSSVDLELPGLIPFNLARTYDSSRANDQIGVHINENGTYQNETTIRKEELSTSLGRGWYWEVPSINLHAGVKKVYLPSIGTFKLTDTLQLEGYAWKDITIQADSTVSVNGITSTYRISILNGYDYLLSAEGALLQIKDSYGNKIDFTYTSQNGVSVLDQIRNQEGSALQFLYEESQITVQLSGTARKVIYQKSDVNGYKVLNRVIDSMNRTTKYSYETNNSRFNFLPGLTANIEEQGINQATLLTQIIHPSSAVTNIHYISLLKKIGPVATQHVYKVLGRDNQYSTTLGQEILGSVSFTYSGEDLDSYGKATNWVTTSQDGRIQGKYSFTKSFGGEKQPDWIRLKQQLQKGDETTYTSNYSYATEINRNTPLQVEEFAEQAGLVSDKLVSNYTYDDQGMITSSKLSTGQESTYKYQFSAAPYHWQLPLRTEVKVNDTLKRIEEYSYNPKGTSIKSVVYNGSGGLLLAQSDYVIDEKGRLKTSIIKDNRNDIQTTYAYESPYGAYLPTSESTTVHDALSKTQVVTERFNYTPAGQLQNHTDGSGKEQFFEYDANGRLTKTVFRDGTEALITYDDVNHLIIRKAADGIITKQQYNPFGLMVEEQTANAAYQFVYDREGNLISSTDAEKNTTRYTTDAFGRQVQTQFPDGTTALKEYNVVGKNVINTDAVGNKIRGNTDLLGRIISVEEWKEGSFVPLEKREYDLSSNITSVTDGNGQRTQYTYDAIGQLQSVLTPDQRTTRYIYGLTGQILSMIYPDTQVTTKQYDELGRLIKQIDPQNQSTSYFYDLRSNLIQQIDRLGRSTAYTYSSENLLTGVTGTDFSVTYTYDDRGRRKSMTDATGTTSYTYAQADGFLQSMSYPDGTQIDFENNSQQRIGYSVIDTVGASLKISGKLNEMNRVTSMDVTIGSAAQEAGVTSIASPLDNMTFEYQANGLLKSQLLGSGLQTGFKYDGYQLASLTTQQNRTMMSDFGYLYDNNKNISSRTQNGVEDQYLYDSLNRIKSESGSQNENYSYNANGNRLDSGSGKIHGLKNANYTYDAQNRLVKVQGEGKDVVYSYNGDGLLYERKEKDEITRYYYDDEAKLVAEAKISSSDGSKLSYVYVYDLNGQLKSRLDKESGKIQYYQLNGHGDVIGLVDAEGKILNSYSYDIWGGPLTAKETVPNSLRYSGEYWDDTTGLQYLRARWYDPGTARFMNEDTYEGEQNNPLSLNLYTYVQNNPLKYVDPSGHIGISMYPSPALICASDPENCEFKLKTQVEVNKTIAIEAANFLLFDDINTLKNSDTSLDEKALALASLAPWGKLIKLEKVGSLVKKGEKILGDCNCFTAGTKVQTDEGEKNIEDIEVGDKVLSKNEETGEQAYKEVTHLYRNDKEIIYELTIGDQVIETTDNHPFWVEGKGWVLAVDLQVGDKLQQSNGNTLTIDTIKIVKHDEKVRVYNFTVADFHTYFVSDLGIWVHNINKFCGSASDLADLARNSKKNDGLQGAKVSADLIHDASIDFVGKGAKVQKIDGGMLYTSKDGLSSVRTGQKYGKGVYEANFESFDKKGNRLTNYHVELE